MQSIYAKERLAAFSILFPTHSVTYTTDAQSNILVLFATQKLGRAKADYQNSLES